MPQISSFKHSIIEKYHFQKNIEVFKDAHRGFSIPKILFFQLPSLKNIIFRSASRILKMRIEDFESLRFHFYNFHQ